MKYAFLTVLALLLTACGFTPMHSSSGGAAFDKMSVSLENGKDLGDDQTGFFTMQRLRDRMGNNAAAPHELILTPNVRRRSIGITDQDVASRYDTTLIILYRLVDKKTGEVLDKGRVESVTTFGAPQDSYGVVSSDTSSKQQTAKEMADRLLNIMARYYANTPAP